jgi:hypothetical protein
VKSLLIRIPALFFLAIIFIGLNEFYNFISVAQQEMMIAILFSAILVWVIIVRLLWTRFKKKENGNTQ